MNTDNFLNFSILFGCFISALFAILKFNHVVDIMLVFLMTAFCINIILKFGIALVVKYTMIKRKTNFSDDYDEHLEKLRISMNKLEKQSLAKIRSIYDLEINKMVHKKK